MPSNREQQAEVVALRLRQHTLQEIVDMTEYGYTGNVSAVLKRQGVGSVLNHKQTRNREALALRDQNWSLQKVATYLGYDSKEQASNAIRSLRWYQRKKQHATVRV